MLSIDSRNYQLRAEMPTMIILSRVKQFKQKILYFTVLYMIQYSRNKRSNAIHWLAHKNRWID